MHVLSSLKFLQFFEKAIYVWIKLSSKSVQFFYAEQSFWFPFWRSLRIPKVKIVKNPLLFQHQGIHNAQTKGIHHKSMLKPGQPIGIAAFNALKETTSEYDFNFLPKNCY